MSWITFFQPFTCCERLRLLGPYIEAELLLLSPDEVLSMIPIQDSDLIPCCFKRSIHLYAVQFLLDLPLSMLITGDGAFEAKHS